MAELFEVRHHTYRRPSREFWTVEKRQWNGLVLVRNAAGRVKHFRSAETAQAECDKLNSTPGVSASDDQTFPRSDADGG